MIHRTSRKRKEQQLGAIALDKLYGLRKPIVPAHKRTYPSEIKIEYGKTIARNDSLLIWEFLTTKSTMLSSGISTRGASEPIQVAPAVESMAKIH